jgi:hypothetical protein
MSRNQGSMSKNRREVGVRTTGKGSEGIRPAWVGQRGIAQGDHVTTARRGDTGYRGEKREGEKSFQPVPFGNSVALNSKSAPGQGRTIHARGTQCQTGPANPGSPPERGELFPGWPTKQR